MAGARATSSIAETTVEVGEPDARPRTRRSTTATEAARRGAPVARDTGSARRPPGRRRAARPPCSSRASPRSSANAAARTSGQRSGSGGAIAISGRLTASEVHSSVDVEHGRGEDVPPDVGLHQPVAAVPEPGVHVAGLQRPVERHERRRLVDRPAPGVREPHTLQLREHPQQPPGRHLGVVPRARSPRDRRRGRRTPRCPRHRRSRSCRRRSGAGSRATRDRRRSRPARSSRSPPADRGSARSPRRSRRSRRSSDGTAPCPRPTRRSSARRGRRLIAPCSVRTTAGRVRSRPVIARALEEMDAAFEQHPSEPARQTRWLAHRAVGEGHAAEEPGRVARARALLGAEQLHPIHRCRALAEDVEPSPKLLLPCRRPGRRVARPCGTSSRCPFAAANGRSRRSRRLAPTRSGALPRRRTARRSRRCRTTTTTANPPLRPLAPPPTMSCSMSAIRRPGSRSVSRSAVQSPANPPPTMHTSADEVALQRRRGLARVVGERLLQPEAPRRAGRRHLDHGAPPRRIATSSRRGRPPRRSRRRRPRSRRT